MNLFVYIALPLLGIIFWQDLRSRAIWWFLPPVLFAAFVLLRWEFLSLATIAYNAVFVTALIGFLVVYVRLRFGKLENPFQNYFGLGDYLFLLALTPLFPFRGFVWFFTAGTIAVLLVHLVVLLFRNNRTIPYAGYFSLFTALYLVADTLSPSLLNVLTAWHEQVG